MATVALQDIDDKKKEQNYVRLNLMIVKLSTLVLKARFDHTIPPGPQLHQELNKAMKIIRNGRIKKIITQKQYDLLFPQAVPPSSDKFDITLLVYLLKHICGLDQKCKWWKEKDNNNIPETRVGEIADIVRIRNVRNEIQHLRKAIVDQKDFEDNWDVTEKAMIRLGAICNLPNLKKEIDTVRNQPFETVKEKIIVIMQSHGYDDDFGDYYDDDDEVYDDDYDDYDDFDDYNDNDPFDHDFEQDDHDDDNDDGQDDHDVDNDDGQDNHEVDYDDGQDDRDDDNDDGQDDHDVDNDDGQDDHDNDFDDGQDDHDDDNNDGQDDHDGDNDDGQDYHDVDYDDRQDDHCDDYDDHDANDYAQDDQDYDNDYDWNDD